jgi:hypothetical protein
MPVRRLRKNYVGREEFNGLRVCGKGKISGRMLKKFVQQGHSE